MIDWCKLKTSMINCRGNNKEGIDEKSGKEEYIPLFVGLDMT